MRGILARRHLDAVRAEVTELGTVLVSGDRSTVPARLDRVRRAAAAARTLTSDPVWSLLARVPVAGRSLRTGAGLARAVDEVARDALPALDRASGTLSLRSIRPAGDTIALDRFAAARQPLEQVRDSVTRTERRVRSLPGWLVLPVIADARRDLLDQLASLRAATTSAADAAALVPPMLGRDGPRRYLVAFLNNAEMRGSGGMLGAYGILVADRGRLRMREVETNDDLRSARPPVVDLGPEYAARYDRFSTTTFWQNANMSPHFPHAARIWLALWQDNRRERLDGVIAVDPVAMSRILSVTGPATLPGGEQVTAENVVRLTESEVYLRFPRSEDNAARGEYFVSIAEAIYGRFVSGSGATTAMLTALGDAASSRHLQVASAHAAEQSVIERSSVGGVLPPATDVPFLLVTTQNAGGNKLDYYIRRSVRYERDGRTTTVEVRLTNEAPPGLPRYVAGRHDLAKTAGVRPPGEQHVYLSLFAGGRALLLDATLDGKPLHVESERERGHPVYSTFLDVGPGVPRVVRFRLRDEGDGQVQVIQQPVVVPDTLSIG